MCLEEFRDFDVETKRGVGIGYKKFRFVGKNHAESLFFCTKKIVYDKWLKEEGFRRLIHKNVKMIYPTSVGKYAFGFHVFTNEKEARTYKEGQGFKLLPVRFRKVVAKGVQGYFIEKKTVVAKEMFVPTPRQYREG